MHLRVLLGAIRPLLGLGIIETEWRTRSPAVLLTQVNLGGMWLPSLVLVPEMYRSRLVEEVNRLLDVLRPRLCFPSFGMVHFQSCLVLLRIRPETAR